MFRRSYERSGMMREATGQTAHAIAQDVDDENGAWVHAYLHRKEGDRSNARYWYLRAHKPEATDCLDSEWARIVSELM
jgi:hypothetical protein